MSKKKKQASKKKVQKQKKQINWQKLKWPITLTCIGVMLAVVITLLLTMGFPVKGASSPDGLIAVQMRWKGFGRYTSEYTSAPQGKDVDVSLRGVRRLVNVEFTSTGRYLLFVYKGAQGRQYFYVVDYLTGRSGSIDPALIFKAEVPNRQNATNVKVTFQKMDPEYDAAIFRIDYTMANGEDHYEHITYDLKTDHLQ